MIRRRPAENMEKLERYVGHNIRLSKQVFQEIAQREGGRGYALQNCFVVSAVSRKLRKLVCYGACGPIHVGMAEVALM